MSGITFTYDRPGNISDTDWSSLITTALKKLRANTPVRTGALQASWVPSGASKKKMSIDNHSDYAEYVDEGNTRGMAPRNIRKQTEDELDAIAKTMAIKSLSQRRTK